MGGSLIDVGGLAEPATRLIDRIADAVGWTLEPRQIRRIATAEADADKMEREFLALMGTLSDSMKADRKIRELYLAVIQPVLDETDASVPDRPSDGPEQPEAA